MSRGLQIALVSSILLLALGVAGLGAYVFMGHGQAGAAAQAAAPAESAAADAAVVFFKTKNFVTDLADKDRLRYVDVTVALAVRDAVALEEVKKMEPQIRDTILAQLRVRVAADPLITTL